MIQADICMLVDTFVKRDSRVLREARSLSSNGFSVVVIGVYSDPNIEIEQCDSDEIDKFQLIQYSYPAKLNSTKKYLILKIVTYILALLHSMLRVLLPIPLLLTRIETLFRKTSRDWLPVGILFQKGLSQVSASIYHAHDYPAIIAISQYDRPFVYDSHELYFDRDQLNNRMLRWFIQQKHAVEKRLETHSARKALAIITVSDGIADFLTTCWSVTRPLVIRNTINLQTRQPAINYPIPPDTKAIVHSGNLTKGRNLITLVSSLKFLPDHIVLVLMGDGPLRNALEEIVIEDGVEGRLFIIPPVPPEEVASTLSQAHVAVILIATSTISYRLSLPNKLFEAVVAGLPIITSLAPEIAKLTRENDIGICIDAQYPEKIARAILDVLQPENYGKYKHNVLQSREVLNWENEEKALIALYDRLLQKSAPRVLESQ